MDAQSAGSGEPNVLPQGDLRLSESDAAKRLLSSTVPARLAYLWSDGMPRVVPMWFHWTGVEFVMATFATAPKIEALRANPQVAITIDTEGFPPDVLSVPRSRVGHRDAGGGARVRAGRASLSWAGGGVGLHRPDRSPGH